MSLEDLSREDLGEDVRRAGLINLRRYQLDRHHAGATQLTHLEELLIDVSRILRRREAVAEVVCPLLSVPTEMGPSRRNPTCSSMASGSCDDPCVSFMCEYLLPRKVRELSIFAVVELLWSSLIALVRCRPCDGGRPTDRYHRVTRTGAGGGDRALSQ